MRKRHNQDVIQCDAIDEAERETRENRAPRPVQVWTPVFREVGDSLECLLDLIDEVVAGAGRVSIEARRRPAQLCLCRR